MSEAGVENLRPPWIGEPSQNLQEILRHFLHLGILARALCLLMAIGLEESFLIQPLSVHLVIYLIAWPLLRMRKWNTLILVCGLEWLFFNRIWFVYFGWNCGFSIYYYGLTISTLLFDHIPLRLRIIMAIGPLLLFQPLLMFMPPLEPVAEITEYEQKLIMAGNSLVFAIFTMLAVVHALRRMASAKVRAEKLAASRTRLIANLSHELKTPLAATHATLQTAQIRERTPEEYAKVLQKAERNTRGMSHLIQRMLDFASAGDDKIHPQPEPVRLADLLRVCVELHQPIADESKVTIQCYSEPGLCIATDPDLLSIIVSNLLSNAVRHSPENGIVKVRIDREPDGNLLLSVSDQGTGISDKDLPYIFDAFYRADKARTRFQGNIGLGLSTVKEYADMLGYVVSVQTSPGAGTKFLIHIAK